MKIIIILMLALTLLLGGVAFYVFNSLDSIVVSMIEEHGSRATGTAVRVGSIDIQLTQGKATIHNLRVANPPGFGAEDAFTLSLVTVELDLRSLGSRLVPMTEVVVAGPIVNFEMTADGKSNLDQIYASLDQGGDGGGSDSTSSGDPPPDLRIDHFRFEQGQIHANATAVGGPERTVGLPQLDLTDLGAPDGAPPARVGSQIVSAMIREAGKRLAQAGLEDYIDEKLGGKAGEAVKDVLKGILN